jgi:hypothetical protein
MGYSKRPQTPYGSEVPRGLPVRIQYGLILTRGRHPPSWPPQTIDSRLVAGRCLDALGGVEMESLSHVVGLSYPSGEFFIELIERFDTELVYEKALCVGRS